jgi:hypothetical protein
MTGMVGLELPFDQQVRRGIEAEGRRASPGRPPARRFGRNLRIAWMFS